MLRSLSENAGILFSITIALAVAMIALAGCKTVPTQDATIAAHVAVTYATGKYIEKAGDTASQQARARRVVAVVEQIEGLATGDTSVTIDALKAFVIQRLPVDLSPADRTLAITLVEVAADELAARVGAGQLSGTNLLKVREVLQWVRESAASYTGS